MLDSEVEGSQIRLEDGQVPVDRANFGGVFGAEVDWEGLA